MTDTGVPATRVPLVHRAFAQRTAYGLLRFSQAGWTAATSNFGDKDGSMDKPVVVPREQALAEARQVLDAARARRDADYRAGRLTGRRLEVFERLLAERAAEAPADGTAA